MPKIHHIGLADAGKTDSDMVDNARDKLLQLLDDPYFFEAYQNLRNENHPKLHKISGRRYKKKGELAKKIQSNYFEEINLKNLKKGRPTKVNAKIYDYLILRCDELNISLKESCRRVLIRKYGDKYKNTYLDKLYNSVSSYKKREKMAKRT